MLKKFACVSLLAIGFMSAPQANNLDSCFVEVAVSTPPVELSSNVAFNVTNEDGISRSITLSGGSAPKTIEKLPCLSSPYIITATEYETPPNQLMASGEVGQCRLKVGAVMLSAPTSSVSVVFPQDFECNSLNVTPVL